MGCDLCNYLPIEYRHTGRREMTLRPLSQSGLRRIAKNASQRLIGEDGHPAKKYVLDAFNDKAIFRVLHATKGWRPMSARRSTAQLITAEVRRGIRPFTSDAMR